MFTRMRSVTVGAKFTVRLTRLLPADAAQRDPCRAVPTLHLEVGDAVLAEGESGRWIDRAREVVLHRIHDDVVDRLAAAEVDLHPVRDTRRPWRRSSRRRSPQPRPARSPLLTAAAGNDMPPPTYVHDAEATPPLLAKRDIGRRTAAVDDLRQRGAGRCGRCRRRRRSWRRCCAWRRITIDVEQAAVRMLPLPASDHRGAAGDRRAAIGEVDGTGRRDCRHGRRERHAGAGRRRIQRTGERRVVGGRP